MGKPVPGEGSPDPDGALELTANPGDAVLFEQRLHHAVGPNTDDDVPLRRWAKERETRRNP